MRSIIHLNTQEQIPRHRYYLLDRQTNHAWNLFSSTFHTFLNKIIFLNFKITIRGDIPLSCIKLIICTCNGTNNSLFLTSCGRKLSGKQFLFIHMNNLLPHLLVPLIFANVYLYNKRCSYKIDFPSTFNPQSIKTRIQRYLQFGGISGWLSINLFFLIILILEEFSPKRYNLCSLRRTHCIAKRRIFHITRAHCGLQWLYLLVRILLISMSFE